MTEPLPAAGVEEEEFDERFDDLVEQITEPLKAGTKPELSEYAAKWPEYADRLTRLFPVLTSLATSQDDVQSTFSTPRALPEGTVLGDYRIVRLISRGGMGVVYEAEQISLRRPVAVKVLSWTALPDEQVNRFRREARAAARLRHRNIVSVYEVGECKHGHFYSMEYIAGRDLATVAAGQPMPPRVAAYCMRAVARAVHYAHEQGILHR